MKYAALIGLFCALISICFAHHSQSHECEEEKPRNSRHTDNGEFSGYIFTSARSLKTGARNELHFKRFGSLDEGFLKVKVFYKKEYNSPNETIAAAAKFEIPEGYNDVLLNLTVNKLDQYVYNGRLQINGTFGDRKISGSSSISFSTPKTSIVIIQTDKPLYQPGQTVHFRVLKVNKHLKPSAKNSRADVFVEDPKGTRLFQFLNINVAKGIVQREFELANEPAFGSWTIKVVINGTTETTSFVVKEYVLPKFDVNIKFPSFVLANAELIPIQICAKYTYGKPVIGTLNLNASLEKYYYEIYDSSSQQKEKYPTLQESVELNGCYDYTLDVSKIEPGNDYSYRRIMIVANVIEEGTGVERNVTEYLQRQTSPLNLNFIDSLDFYKPGLPYNGKLKVSNPDNTAAAGESIEICAKISKKRVIAEWWATKTLQICRNYTSDENGIIPYIMMPQNIDAISVVLSAKSNKYAPHAHNSGGKQNILSQPQTSKYLNAYYSPSGSFIQLQPVHQPVPCGSKQTLKLLFTSKKSSDFKFYYTVTRQSNLILEDSTETSFSVSDDVSSQYEDDDKVINGKEVQLDPPADSISNSAEDDCPAAKESRFLPPVGEVDVEIDVDSSSSPEIHVLVYYVRDDEEVVADSMKIEIAKCLPNKVDFAFADKVQQPGLETAIKIRTGSNSLCGIKAVDKSITLLDNRDQLTQERIFQLVANLDTNQYYANNPCYQHEIQPGLDNVAFKSIIRPPTGASSSYQDSLTAFQTAGFLVISDLFVVTRPCSFNNGGGIARGGVRNFAMKSAVAFDSATADVAGPGEAASSVTQSVKQVRDFFPETWLFEMELVGPDGMFETHKKLPDTITDWVGSAVCINSEDGLGISNTTSITAFQAFFLDFTLPISVIRGEEFVVVVSLFNYVEDALPVTVTVDDPEGYEITGQSIDGNVCVHPNVGASLRMTLKATTVGKINITVRAETAKDSNVCGESSVSDSYARDAIKKSVEVEAEGFPAENVINALACPSDEEGNVFETSVTLSLPNDVIPDSSRAYIDFTGNIMGPAINNLDRLVDLPTGCGEQNMVKFTPNYLVLDYLKSIGKLTDEIKTKAIRNLNTGYQRELNYQHYDGSFSAFGETDNTGSMFLTAFVLRSFYEAQRYIAIDNNILKRAQDWIVSKRGTNGCFPNIGRIIDIDLQGGLKEESVSGSITAYVLASLIISKYDNETIINEAFNCLKDNPPSSPYSEFLYAYSYALAGKTNEAQDYITEARTRVNKTGGMEYFIIVNGTEAIEIETDAYAVLTTLEIGGTALDVLPYIRYLTTHLNPNGGFKSTQDTCVGLTALSKFASIVYKDPLNLEVTTTGGLQQTVDITADNQLLVQRYKVSDVPSEVNIKATGTGCALIQTAVRYNTKTPPEKKMFALNVIGECSDAHCTQATIEVLVSYLPSGLKSGMSIVDIKLITGFVAVKESLDNLKSDKRNNILRVDVQNNKVIFYLSEISNSVQKFSFQVNQVVEVKNAQPGTAKVYDYYANENSASTSYVIEGYHSGSNAV